MSFWTTGFMDRRRKQFLEALVKFQFQVNGVWNDAVINSKRITGNTVEIIASFPRTASGKQTITGVRVIDVTGEQTTITGVRVIDVTGEQCGFQAVSITRAVNQGVLVKFEFPIYEKEGEG